MTFPHAQPEGEFFDALIADAGEFNPFTERGWRTLATRFSYVCGRAGNLRVLDIGCGTGQSHVVYERHTKAYVGLDLSLGAVRKARQTRPSLSWVQADATILPFKPQSFDVVAFSSVLHHVPDMAAALGEARRVLEPGGLVFAFDPNVLHPAMALFRHPRSPLYQSAGVSPHERPLLPSVLRAAFIDAGLSDVGQRCQSDIPYRHLGPAFLRPWLSAFNWADRLWELTGAGRWFGTFAVTWGRVPR